MNIPMAGPIHTRSWWRVAVGAAALALVSIATILAQIGALLRSMHPPGEPSGSVLNVSPEVVNSWYVQSAEVERVTRPLEITFNSGLDLARTWLAWDTLAFLPAYASLTLLLLWGIRRAGIPTNPLGQAVVNVLRNPFWWVVLACLVLADLLENAVLHHWIGAMWNERGEAVTPSPIDCGVALCAAAQSALTVVKNLATVLLMLATLISLVAVGSGRLPRLWRTVKRLRAQVLVVVILALLFRNEQVQDAFRSWDRVRILWSFVATLMLAITVTITGWRLLLRTRSAVAPEDIPRPVLIWGGAVGTVLAIATCVLGLPGLTVVFGLLGAVFLLSIPIHGIAPSSAPTNEPGDEASHDFIGVLPRLLGAAIIFLVGLTGVKALALEVFYVRSEDVFKWGPMRLFVISVLIVALSGTLFGSSLTWLTDHPGVQGASAQASIGRHPIVVAITVTALSLVVFGLVLIEPFAVPAHLGSVALLMIFLTIALFLVTAVVTRGEWVTARWKVPASLRVLGFKELPILLLILVWSVGAGIADRGGYHDVRRKPVAERAASPLDFDTYFEHWDGRQVDENTLSEAIQRGGVGDSRRGVPLILIAASGGGIRAAFWTASVLDCVFEGNTRIAKVCAQEQPTGDEARRSIFAVSGISGGSLGLASYEAYMLDPDAATNGTQGDWVRARLQRDFLSANLARNLFLDTPLAWVRPEAGVDHAEILERDWERAWGDNSPLARGLRDVMRLENDLPLSLFNSLSASDGCRFNVSVLDTNGSLGPESCSRQLGGAASGDPQLMTATHDLMDFLRNEDLPLSTAVHLSARFPYVSPAGRLVAYDEAGEEQSVVYLVDGGTRDSSAASPLVELYPTLMEKVDEHNRTNPETCLVPLFIQIDNGYSTYGVHKIAPKPEEFLIPVGAGLSSLRTNADAARQSAHRVFVEDEVDHLGTRFFVTKQETEQTEPLSRYIQITTRAHPGVQAPLGWLLSDSSADDLRRQITVAEPEIDAVTRWLRPTPPSCAARLANIPASLDNIVARATQGRVRFPRPG